MEPEYSWQAVKSSGPGYHREPVNRNYGWWVMLASLLATAFHVVLYLAFENIEVRQWAAMYDQVIQLGQEREKITIDEATLSRLKEEEKPLPEVKEMPPQEVPVEDLPLELPKETETIRLTPAVSEPQNVFAAAPAPDFSQEAKVGAMEESMSFDLAEMASGEVLKNDLLKASEKISAQQPKLYIKGSELPVGLESDDLVKQMTNTIGGAEAAKIQGRFDSMDELLGSGNAMPKSAEILIPTDLLFEFGSADIREEAKLSLMKLGMLVMANPRSTFLFKGYTDSIKFRLGRDLRLGPKDNLELSLARATAVRDWLANSLDLRGFDLRVQGFGDANPLVQPRLGDPVEVAKVREALNRRVEVEIISKQ